MKIIENLPSTPNTSIIWRNEQLYLLDQRLLPHKEIYLALDNLEEVANAIRDMVVRGAPAIGISAAYGVAMGARARFAADPVTWRKHLNSDIEILAHSRPTAVNLFWALKWMKQTIDQITANQNPFPVLLATAQVMHAEDAKANHRMGSLGANLIDKPTEVITHCNAGALATGGYGTALGVIRAAYAAGKLTQVWANETRPWLQGARLTTWELQKDGIPVTLQADTAAAMRMQQGAIGWVIVGADRIAANGDVANKIGTYQLAITARYHQVKFMVVASTSTIDINTSCGTDIPIEQRPSQELLGCGGNMIAPANVIAWNPVFDITPAALINALVTERGVILNPDTLQIKQLMTISNYLPPTPKTMVDSK